MDAREDVLEGIREGVWGVFVEDLKDALEGDLKDALEGERKDALEGECMDALDGDLKDAFESFFFSIEAIVSPAKLARDTHALGVTGGRAGLGVPMVRLRSGVGLFFELRLLAEFGLRSEVDVLIGVGR